jgi:type I restriction enzyme M protein
MPSRSPLLQPLSEQAEDVFFAAHSHIRDIDGLHADAALDELCKLIQAKLHDERPDTHSHSRWRCGGGQATDEFAATLRKLHAEAAGDGEPVRLSDAALVQVARALEPWSLSASRIDVRGRAFQRVLAPAARAGMGQYFTPDSVVEFLAAALAPAPGERVLDPFAGSGLFLWKSLDFARQRGHDSTGSTRSTGPVCSLFGIEKSARMVRIARTEARLLDEPVTLHAGDALAGFAALPGLQPASFDVVLTNPPFGSVLSKGAVAQLGPFALANGRRGVPLEILGLERCVEFLRPGGRLGIVLPDGVLANQLTRPVRDWLAGAVKLRAVVSLPPETFQPFGANVKTSILLARKWRDGERWTPDGIHDDPVRLIRVDRIGYDATGRADDDGSELPAAAELLKAFLAAEGW